MTPGTEGNSFSVVNKLRNFLNSREHETFLFLFKAYLTSYYLFVLHSIWYCHGQKGPRGFHLLQKNNVKMKQTSSSKCSWNFSLQIVKKIQFQNLVEVTTTTQLYTKIWVGRANWAMIRQPSQLPHNFENPN